MTSLSESQLLHLLISLGVILIWARTLGEIARRFGLPEVLGQLIAGVTLGPSLLGLIGPGFYDVLFGDPPAANGLSAISWLGAILIFLSAGVEADLRILRRWARSGLFVAAGAVLPSIAGGLLLGWLALGQPPIAGLFLGVTLSVTAVSVLVTILDESGAMRRDYGQVLLAAGVVTEMAVWVFIPVVSALLNHHPSPIVAALIALAGVVGVFVFMLSIGQVVVHQALRWVADHARINRSPISVILAVTLLSAALTQSLGLHPLLGAFAAGMVLVRAPRVRPPLLQSVQTLTTGFLAPIFFAFAGTRVNLREIGGWSGIRDVVVLLVGASLIKIVGAVVMGRASRVRRSDALIVGLGMNLKGGTDVIVALVGTELGFFPERIYSIYGTVAVLTVLLSAPVLSRLDRANTPTDAEIERLRLDAARDERYPARVERVLRSGPDEPGLVDAALGGLKTARDEQGWPFDIASGSAAVVADHLSGLGQRVDLVAVQLGADEIATGPEPSGAVDRLLQSGQVDVLLTTADGTASSGIRRILVPYDGRPASLAAVDLAACLLSESGGEVVPLRVRPASVLVIAAADPAGPNEDDDGLAADYADGARAMDELLRARTGSDPDRIGSLVVGGPDIVAAIKAEIERGEYDAMVIGAIAHRGTTRSRLGRTVDGLLAAGLLPTVVLVPR